MGFSAYLQSIIADYEKQRDHYTLTELQVKYRDKEERLPDRPQQQLEEKAERLEVLAGLRKYVRQGHVLLLGKPGSGKSTALQRLRWELAQSALVDEQQPIPVLVVLRSLRHHFGILEAIAFELQKGDPDLDLESKDIRRFLLNSRLFLLLDGVNEVPSDDLHSDVKLFRGDFSKAPMIFTSRELEAGLGIEQKLEMCGLTDPQMRSLVENYLPNHSEGLLRQLSDRLRELAETPLILKLLCDVFDPVTQQIPQSKGELFRAVDAKYNTWKKGEGVRTAEHFWQWNGEILCYLAFVMLQADDTPTGKWLQIEQSQAEQLLEQFLRDRVTAPGEKAKDWLQDLLEHHLLQSAAKPNEIEFHHQLFQEYYAAEYLRRQLPNLSNARLKRDYLNLLKWTESLVMLLSLLPDKERTVQIAELSLDVDWILGVRLTEGVNPDLQNRLVEKIIQLEIPEWLTITLVGKTKSLAATNYLTEKLKHPNPSIRSRAVWTLKELRTEIALPLIRTAIEDLDSGVRQTTIRVIGELRIEQAVPLLQQILNQEEDAQIRELVVICALGRLSSDEAILELLRAMQDTDNNVSLMASHSLEERDHETIMPVLFKALKNTDSSIRQNAAKMLGKLKNERAISTLSEVDQFDLDEDVKFEAYWAILQIQKEVSTKQQNLVAQTMPCPKEIDMWQKHLTSDEPVPRGNAINYLTSHLNLEEAISLAKKALKDEAPYVREHALGNLAKLLKQEAVSLLIQSLDDPDCNVCEKASQELVNLKTNVSTDSLIPEETVTMLIQRFDESQNIYKRRQIINICLIKPNICSRPELENSFLKALNSLDPSEPSNSLLRSSAVRGLGLLSSENACANLLQLLGDSDDLIAMSASKSLGKMPYQVAIKFLPELTKVTSSSVGSNAFRSMTAIQVNCQFYNYEIFQSPPEPSPPTFIDLHTKIDTIDQRTKQMAEQPNQPIYQSKYQIKGNPTIVEGNMEVKGDNVGTKTVYNYFGADNDLKQQTADLHQFIAELEAKHPQVQTETAANDIIDAEIVAVQTNDINRWQILRQQMLLLKRQILNPERQIQALKAGLGEVAKHYLEDSVWAKAILTYIDKLSETPDQGA